MFDIRKYRFGFDVWGFLLFAAIMIPNFFWFAVPAPVDILRSESATSLVDTIASIFQVILAGSLCFVVNCPYKKPLHREWRIGIVAATILYFAGWFFYYFGIVNAIIVLDLCVAPCMAFLLLSIVRKNIIALISSVVFLLCHCIYGIVNFIV